MNVVVPLYQVIQVDVGQGPGVKVIKLFFFTTDFP
jgi:hypothetical protein